MSSFPKRTKSHQGSRDFLHKSYPWPSLAMGAFRTPTATGEKTKSSTGKEKSIKIISYRSKKILLSCTPLPGIIWGGFTKATYTGILLAPSTWENTELHHGGSLLNLIALYSQRNFLLTSSQPNKNSGRIINKFSMGLQPEISKSAAYLY